MKFIFFLILIVAFTSCENTMKRHAKADDPEITDEVVLTDEDIVEDSDKVDETVDADVDRIILNPEFVSVVRQKKSLQFPNIADRFIVQKAELDFSGLTVKRNMNHVDTSFSIHKNDSLTIQDLIKTDIEKTGCLECEKGNEEFLRIVLKTEEICCITDVSKIEEIDGFLMIPVHTMLWPFAPSKEPHPVGHTTVNIQRYSEDYSGAYFHQGVDIVKDGPVDIFNPYDGRVTEIGYYRVEDAGESPYYFQVVTKTVNGLQFQFHHTDSTSVPEEIYNIKGSNTILKAEENTGKIVFWPTADSFSNKFFHHIHFNVLTEQRLKLNALQLMIPQKDEDAPVIEELFLIDKERTKTVSTDKISEEFQVVIKAYDFAGGDPWPNPPRLTRIRITGAEGETVYEHEGFDFTGMMSESEFDFVCDYYLCTIGGTAFSKGDYSERAFYIVTTAFDIEGNKTPAISPDLFEAGDYTIIATACDEVGNCFEKSLEISF